jgi:PAS domain S-box-containing protein
MAPPVAHADFYDHPVRAVAVPAAGLWLLALALLAAAFWFLERYQYAAMTALIGARERTTVDSGAGIVALELKLPLADLPYLTDQAALQAWLADASPGALEQVGTDFLALVRHRDSYAKTRLFDPRGMELVRINRQGKGAERVPRDRLQDKSGRDFVQAGLAQAPGAIHVSRFDPNVEEGVIEKPFRPMLRFGTPVFSPDGQLRGLVTINYPGQRLLDRLAALAPDTAGAGLWLLDTNGYWLLGEHPEDAWGFMVPEGAGPRFHNRYPSAWEQVGQELRGDTGQAIIGGDLFTWRRAHPPEPLAGWTVKGPGAAGWILVSRVPASNLAALFADQRRLLFGGFAGLALGTLLAALAVAYYRFRCYQARDQARAGEARLSRLVESAPDAVVMGDSTGRITLVNAKTEVWFGYRREELLGMSSELLVPERLRARFCEYRDRFIAASGEVIADAGLEFVGRRKDGSEFSVELSLSPLLNPEGRGIAAIIRDITERRRLEAVRLEAQSRYRDLVENLPIGVYRSSLSEPRRFLEVNPALVAMFEAESAEQLLAELPAHLYRDESARAEVVRQLKNVGVIAARELTMVTLHGREFDAALSGVAKVDVAGCQYVDGVIEDIGARKQSEREVERLHEVLRQRASALEAANHELEAFSYSVSHDLRTPLRAVDGFSRILLDEYAAALDDRGADYLRRVRAAAQHMAALIDDLLKLARVSRADLKPAPVDLGTLAEEIIAGLRQRDPERVVTCRIQTDLIGYGDARLLRVVLDNLLDNAWKFTGHRVDAVIEFGAEAGSDGPVYHVRDDGVGFDMAYADKLFGAFQRLHDRSEFPGTGIGLATAQRVIHKHGGRIWVEARADAGATFYFTLGTQEAI